MWIGCADSRVPANEITGLDPGEVFVHRNVANVVVHSDLNALSTIQFAVEHLKVKHIMVVGHYGCAGVRAAMRGLRVGLADNWLRHVQDVRLRHASGSSICRPSSRKTSLCEMNVIEQVGNVALSTVMQDAWARGQEVAIHGWVYGLSDGLLKDLDVTMERAGDGGRGVRRGVEALSARRRSDGHARHQLRLTMTPLHIDTPLLRAPPELFGAERMVWLKMDALQASGSFKMRGVGRLVQQRVAEGARAVVCASGGNAGMAATLAARACGVPVTIVVPQTTAAAVRDAIAARGASVVVHGAVWDEAHEHALALAREQARSTCIRSTTRCCGTAMRR